MNPLAVEFIPTLIFSTKTLLPTSNGKSFNEENPLDNLIVTSLVDSSNSTLLMPTPLLFSTGIIVGVELLIPLVFWRMVTVLSSTEYLKSKSVTI